jgi:hypothetical protein
MGDLRDCHILALEGERRGSGGNIEPRHVGQRVDDLLGETVGEILLSLSELMLAKGNTAIDGGGALN